MTENIGQSAGTAEGGAAKKDCGCGCGGSGGCGESKPAITTVRRRFLTGGLTVAAFSVSLPARADMSTCGPITAMASPHGSKTSTFTCMGGRTPGFWVNHTGCWPSNVKNVICTVTFDDYFASAQNLNPSKLPFSLSEKLVDALNSAGDNLEFQLAGALLNADSFSQFGYSSSAAVAQAVVNAFNAGLTATQVHSALAALNFDNSSNASGCPLGDNTGKGSITDLCHLPKNNNN